jgi:3',5'-cyclic AMP phosphodiesterase CpdA
VRIAHLSDLHLLSLDGAVPFRLLNKRLTGYANLKLHRASKHKPFAVRACAEAIRALAVDHVVITGDLTNLALETEFRLVRRFLEEDLQMAPSNVSIVPGNHDAYTRGAFASKRIFEFLAPYMTDDLPRGENDAPFPYVRLRGAVAIIGISTAVPRLPLVASGRLGRTQLSALERLLAHPEVRQRTPILLQHHPLHNPASRAKTALEGLVDSNRLQELLRQVPRGLVLHGHLHRRVHREFTTATGKLDCVGATSTSLVRDDDVTMAGFNVYEIANDGAIEQITSHRLASDHRSFREVVVPASA